MVIINIMSRRHYHYHVTAAIDATPVQVRC